MTAHDGALWSRRDVVLAAAISAGGVVLMVAGRLRTASASSVDAQIPWLEMAVLGLGLGVGSCLAFVVVGHQRVKARRRQVIATVEALFVSPRATGSVSSALVSVARGTWVHRASCPLTHGKPVQPAGDAASVDGPCPICGSRP